MTAAPERISWRESVAAQLYQIADTWSRGEMSGPALYSALRHLAQRILWRDIKLVDAVARVMSEKEWK